MILYPREQHQNLGRNRHYLFVSVSTAPTYLEPNHDNTDQSAAVISPYSSNASSQNPSINHGFIFYGMPCLAASHIPRAKQRCIYWYLRKRYQIKLRIFRMFCIHHGARESASSIRQI